MNHPRQILTLRISLALAVAGGIAVMAMAQFGLRPQIRQLSSERDTFRKLSDQWLARANQAEARNQQLEAQLAGAQQQAEVAVLEKQRVTDRYTRLTIGLEETRAKLHTAKQEIARWNATGATPDQVASLARENKALAAQVSKLEKHRDQLQVKRTLDVPPDEDAIPQLPPMEGSVLVVDPKWKFVVLDLGENVGLQKNGVFMVSREGKLISKVKVRRVDAERSIADILPGWSVSEVREGDRVIN